MKPARRSTFHSYGLCTAFWKRAREARGDDHPETRAWLGRLFYHRGNVPQRDATSPEAIAWHRESETIPGFLNKAHRKHLARRVRIAVDNSSAVSTGEA